MSNNWSEVGNLNAFSATGRSVINDGSTFLLIGAQSKINNCVLEGLVMNCTEQEFSAPVVKSDFSVYPALFLIDDNYGC